MLSTSLYLTQLVSDEPLMGLLLLVERKDKQKYYRVIKILFPHGMQYYIRYILSFIMTDLFYISFYYR